MYAFSSSAYLLLTYLVVCSVVVSARQNQEGQNEANLYPPQRERISTQSEVFSGFNPVETFEKHIHVKEERGRVIMDRMIVMQKLCKNLGNFAACRRMRKPYHLSAKNKDLDVSVDMAFGLFSVTAAMDIQSKDADQFTYNCVVGTRDYSVVKCSHPKKLNLTLVAKYPVMKFAWKVAHILGRMRWMYRSKGRDWALRPFPLVYELPEEMKASANIPNSFIYTEMFTSAIQFKSMSQSLTQRGFSSEFCRLFSLRAIYGLIIWVLNFSKRGINHGDLHSGNVLIDIRQMRKSYPVEANFQRFNLRHYHFIDLDTTQFKSYRSGIAQEAKETNQKIRPDAHMIYSIVKSVMGRATGSASSRQLEKDTRNDKQCLGEKGMCSPELQNGAVKRICGSLFRILEEQELKYVIQGLPTCRFIMKLRMV